MGSNSSTATYCCVTSGKSLNLSVPHLPYLKFQLFSDSPYFNLTSYGFLQKCLVSRLSSQLESLLMRIGACACFVQYCVSGFKTEALLTAGSVHAY
jgi:hypothetical protein